jgi:hypothetical protein
MRAVIRETKTLTTTTAAHRQNFPTFDITNTNSNHDGISATGFEQGKDETRTKNGF